MINNQFVGGIMKKEIVTILITGITILGITGCGSKTDFQIEYQTQNECNKPELLMSKEERNIYTYCLENTTIKINDEKTELKSYIEENSDAINQIISTLKLEDTLMDGGTQIYKGDITLIKCNTLDGNQDIYIGNKNMEFKQNFCKDNNYTFIRTYTVKEVSKYTEQQYTENGTPVTYGNSFKVTLSEFQGETKTVIINNLWDITLEKDKTYEFEFMLNKDAVEIKDEIESIFKNSTIVGVKETTKTGLEQLQEPISNE